MNRLLAVLSFLVFSLNTFIAVSDAADAPGSSDHPQIKRYEGSEIVKHQHRAFDEYTVPLGKAPSSNRLDKSIVVEGALTRLTYKIPMGRSPLEVLRNYEKELKAEGFEILFEGAGDQLGNYFSEVAGYKKILWPPNIPALTLNSDTQRFLSARKKKPEGDIIATVYAIENRFWAADLKNVQKGQVLVHVDVIESKPMEEKMVTISSEKMADQISSIGSVALYGIYFESDQADIRPKSRPTLDEIAKLLKTNPKLMLLVVGHTDNMGKFAYNLDLSRKRAHAVATEISTRYGIEAHRMTPVGVSYASPVASNRTEEGRAKNRRVELVEDNP